MPHAICPMLQMMMLSDAVCKERKIPGGEVKYQTVLRTGKWFLDVYKPNKKNNDFDLHLKLGIKIHY